LSKLLILGGTSFQTPAIVQALKLGHHVITCDYTPENPGHQYAHEYHNVSTMDRAGVLCLAKKRAIDGILAFASDPAASTAAYVAAKLGLHGAPCQAIEILRNKPLFRSFLRTHGFRVPRFGVPEDLPAAYEMARAVGYPVMVKPCDSSGSKGVSRIESEDDLPAALTLAREYSHSGHIIIEEWIERAGRQIAGDGLVVDGRVVFGCFGDEHFDLRCSMFAPVGESFPGQLCEGHRLKLYAELDRLFLLLGIRRLVFNLDAMVDRSGEIILIEVGPRAGGNFLPQVIYHHTGVQMTDMAIRQALGEPIEDGAYYSKPQGFHASWMIHSLTYGHLAGFEIAPELGEYILRVELLSKPGSLVRRFKSSRDTLGYALFSFPSQAIMEDSMANMEMLLRPLVV